eukprot:PhM_4_TR14077/c5_g1_i1/m.60759
MPRINAATSSVASSSSRASDMPLPPEGPNFSEIKSQQQQQPKQQEGRSLAYVVDPPTTLKTHKNNNNNETNIESSTTTSSSRHSFEDQASAINEKEEGAGSAVGGGAPQNNNTFEGLGEVDDSLSKLKSMSASATRQTSSSIFFRKKTDRLMEFIESLNIPPWVFMIIAVTITIATLLVFAALYVSDEQAIAQRLVWVEDVLPIFPPLFSLLRSSQAERQLSIYYAFGLNRTSLEEAYFNTNAQFDYFDSQLAHVPHDISNSQHSGDVELSFQEVNVARALLFSTATASSGSATTSSLSTLLGLYNDLNLETVLFVGTIGAESTEDHVATQLYRLLLVARMDELLARCRDFILLSMLISNNNNNNNNNNANNASLPLHDVAIADAVKDIEHFADVEQMFVMLTPNAHSNDYAHYVTSSKEYATVKEEMANFLSDPTRSHHDNVLNGNSTRWVATVDAVLKGMSNLQSYVLNENKNDIDAAHNASRLASIAISVGIIVSSFSVAFIMFISFQSYTERRVTKREAARLEETVGKLISLDLLVSLGLDFRTLTSSPCRGMVVCVTSIRLRNLARLAERHGDEAVFAGIAEFYSCAVRTAAEFDGHIIEFGGDELLVILPEVQRAIEASLRLYADVDAANAYLQQRTRGALDVHLEATVVTHHTTVVIGCLGNDNFAQCTILSGSVVDTTNLHRLAHSLGIRVLVTGSVIDETAMNDLLTKGNRFVGQVPGRQVCCRGGDGLRVYDVFLADVPHKMKLKQTTAPVLRRLIHTGCRFVSNRTARTVLKEAKKIEKEQSELLNKESEDKTISMKKNVAQDAKDKKAIRCECFKDK